MCTEKMTRRLLFVDSIVEKTDIIPDQDLQTKLQHKIEVFSEKNQHIARHGWEKGGKRTSS